MPLTQVQGGMLAGSTNTTTTIQSNGVTAITIDSSQNVGIKTSSPTADTILDVAESNTNISCNVRIRHSGAGNQARIFFQNTSTGTASTDGLMVGAASDQAYIHNFENTPLYFATNNTERMRITSGGDFFVGKTSSSTSTSGFEINALTGTSAYAVFTNTRTDGVGDLFILNRQGSTGTLINFFQANSSKGSITTNGSNVAYNTSSDYRLKENIAPMTGALAKVAQLKPCNWTWKINGSNGEGFIAHELQAVVPDAVTGEKDAVETYTDEEGNEQTRPVYQGVDTSFLVATLTAAIQELNAKVEAQAAEIAALKATP